MVYSVSCIILVEKLYQKVGTQIHQYCVKQRDAFIQVPSMRAGHSSLKQIVPWTY